ncbi:hypothetical protein [Streptomyces sp. NPDC002088]|uniref:hypothetical protein n=1 Tax=Streptomyces sp. NPDC002088 TaxID=3154665 RepID=UPI00333282F6
MGRDPYDVFAHQQASMPAQLLLFDQEERPARKGPVDVAATWLEGYATATPLAAARASTERVPSGVPSGILPPPAARAF